MSSGALLLRQLRERRQRCQHQEQSQQKRPEAPAPNHAAGPSNAPPPINGQCSDDGVGLAAPPPAEKATAIAGECTVEVCLGPDCSGGGGGAALLEIEDLASQLHSKEADGMTKVRVVDGGCRDHCTVGPNVYVGGGIGSGDVHFTRVNSPEECRKVVRAVSSGSSCAAEETSGIERIILLREDGRRWRALRQKAATERRLRVKERVPSVERA